MKCIYSLLNLPALAYGALRITYMLLMIVPKSTEHTALTYLADSIMPYCTVTATVFLLGTRHATMNKTSWYILFQPLLRPTILYPCIWNDLPSSIKVLESLLAFKISHLTCLYSMLYILQSLLLTVFLSSLFCVCVLDCTSMKALRS